MSNPQARESFRQRSFVSGAALGVIQGFGPNSYRLALRGLAEHLVRMAARRKAGSGGPRRPASKAVKSAPKRSDNGKDVMLGGIGLTEIRRLIRLVQKTGIGELELTSSGRTVRIAAASAQAEGIVIPARGVPGSRRPRQLRRPRPPPRRQLR